MRSRRPALSVTLVVGALILLISIAIGQRLGDRVLSQATDRHSPIVGPVTTPVPDRSDAALEKNWKREQVISVATDPAFPDPRVTPKPKPKPTPVPATPTPRPPTAAPSVAPYTSPPLPIPIVSHVPGDTETEPAGASPTGRPAATRGETSRPTAPPFATPIPNF
ncbi:MAG: hypothetical protein NVSMB64_25940 [Candidatus Velthaea sp.]